MNPNTQFERDLEQWLQAEAPASAPAGFHATVMDRARTLRQRPGWTTTFPARRFGRGRGMTLLAAAALLSSVGRWRRAPASCGCRRSSRRCLTHRCAVATASPDATSPARATRGTIDKPDPCAGPGRGLDRRPGRWARLALDTTRCGSSMAGCSLWGAAGLKRRPDLRGVVRPGQRDLVRHREACSSHGAASRPRCCATAGCSLGISTTRRQCRDHRRRGVRPGKRDLVRHREDAPGYGQRHGHVAPRRQGPRGRSDGAQLYDPDSGTWTATGKMITPRYSHTATLLPDGKVLVAGGDGRPRQTRWTRPSCTTPTRGPGPRSRTCTRRSAGHHAATLLRDGKVLVDGTAIRDGRVDERLRPGHRNLDRTRRADRATRLRSGTVVGWHGADGRPRCNVRPACPPRRCTTRAPGRGRPPRACSGAHERLPFTLLLDGTVLVAGGSECNDDGVCVRNGRGGAVRPCRRVAAAVASLPEPAPASLPEPDPESDPAGPAPAGGRSRSAERAELDRHGRQQELRARDAVRGRGGRGDVPARRVGDPERGPSRRHRAGDLPLPCQGR